MTVILGLRSSSFSGVMIFCASAALSFMLLWEHVYSSIDQNHHADVGAAAASGSSASGPEYGVDCSFPMHGFDFKCGDILGDREAAYNDYIGGCRRFYPKEKHLCDHFERERIKMMVNQPRSMVNYTSTGYMKIKAPKEVIRLLTEHWEMNQNERDLEWWPNGYPYQNVWSSPSYMVSIDNPTLPGAGDELRKKIWQAAKDTIEQWTGMEQAPTSLYGIRVYTEGAILNPHVDRLPLVSSAIVNVAQDVDEPWPLEVIDRSGRAVNITMEPGDMVLYESGSLIHGRPFALKGRYYANIFIHFEPTGRSVTEVDEEEALSDIDEYYPPYLLRDSPGLDNFLKENPGGWKNQAPPALMQHRQRERERDMGIEIGHHAAATGNVEVLRKLAESEEHKIALHFKDHNGWEPIHQAAREGHVDAIKILLANGADKNSRTHGGKGFSPLNIARNALQSTHAVIDYLESLGAEDYAGEL